MEDLSGRQFAKLTVVRYAPNRIGKKTRCTWECACVCGNTCYVESTTLRLGRARSCGCARYTEQRRTTHGQCRTPAYKSWLSMRDRCRNPNSAIYHFYGGRGIKICAAWETFEGFLADMGPTTPGMSIERKDPNGDYCPENCTWIPRNMQNRNTRRTVFVEVDGRKIDFKTACELVGADYSRTLHRVRNSGMSFVQAVALPVNFRYSSQK